MEGWHKDTALYSLLLQVDVENGFGGEGSSLLNSLLHTAISGYLPFGFQYAALAMTKKKIISFEAAWNQAKQQLS